MSQQTMPPALWTIHEAKVFLSEKYLRPRARSISGVSYSVQTWGDLFKVITSTPNTMTSSAADDLDEEIPRSLQILTGN